MKAYCCFCQTTVDVNVIKTGHVRYQSGYKHFMQRLNLCPRCGGGVTPHTTERRGSIETSGTMSVHKKRRKK